MTQAFLRILSRNSQLWSANNLTSLTFTPIWERHTGCWRTIKTSDRSKCIKIIDLSVFSQDELDAVAWALNTRPRKSLGFKCPAELFLPDTFNGDEYYRRLVALRTWNRRLLERFDSCGEFLNRPLFLLESTRFPKWRGLNYYLNTSIVINCIFTGTLTFYVCPSYIIYLYE